MSNAKSQSQTPPENGGENVATGKEIERHGSAVKLVKHIRGLAELEGGDNSDIVLGAIDKIASATTLNDLFEASEAAKGLDSLKDWNRLGQTVLVSEIRLRTSADKFAKNGVGAYVAIDVLNEDGSTETVTTGAPNVVAFLSQAQLQGFLREPLPLRFMSRETENGALLYVARP